MTTAPMTMIQFCEGLVLVGFRLGGLFIFAPVFSSAAIAGRLKAILLIAMTLSVGPMIVAQKTGAFDFGVASIARETAISLIFGLMLSLIMELANTAGQIVGMQFSFTLVNLLDPNSNVDTPLFSQMFQLLTTTIFVSAGFDRTIIASLLRTYTTAPLGGTAQSSATALVLLPLTGGVFLAAFQLVAPLIAATVLVEVSIALLSRLSPQIPVMALTIPAKSIVGLVILSLTLSSWSAFIEKRFSGLLDVAQQQIAYGFGG